MTRSSDAALRALAREPFLTDLTHCEVRDSEGKWIWAGCAVKAAVHPHGDWGEEQFAESLRLLAATTDADKIEVRFVGGELTAIALPTAKSTRAVMTDVRAAVGRALRPRGG